VVKSKYCAKINVEKEMRVAISSYISTIWENVQRSTGSSIPLIIIISWICSTTFFCDLKCVLLIFT
jgi:hypothetical protein